jgi:T5orf172 domain
LYAVRLDQLRQLPEAQTLLAGLDEPGLLSGAAVQTNLDSMDEDALLAELGIGGGINDQDDITALRHVRSSIQKRAAEEIADRTPCADFEKFKPLFEQVEQDLKSGVRKTLRFGRDASIAAGNYFIVGGQLAYVADVGETIKAPNGESDARLRVIYANGTESNLLRRSLQRALYKDETGRRLTDPDMGPLFGNASEPDDIETGTIYVLRSKSSHPFVAEHRELIHKIGVTSGKVETRIAGADKDATYLLADVEVVATYTLHNINRIRLESIFHRLFSPAQLDLTIQDRFGHPVKPREWFLVPLHVIDEAVQRIRDGSITEVVYDPKAARLGSNDDLLSPIT